MSKYTRIPLDIRQFMIRQRVLQLYREIFRTIRIVPDPNSRKELKEWARNDFRANQNQTDEMAIRMLLQHGQRNLKELKNNLELSGYLPNKGFKRE